MEIHLDPRARPNVLVSGAPYSLTAAWRYVAVMVGHWHLLGYGQWTIVEKSTNEVIGRVGLWNPEGWPEIELGWIIQPSRWGKGLATEAAGAALSWAWENVDIEPLLSKLAGAIAVAREGERG